MGKNDENYSSAVSLSVFLLKYVMPHIFTFDGDLGVNRKPHAIHLFCLPPSIISAASHISDSKKRDSRCSVATEDLAYDGRRSRTTVIMPDTPHTNCASVLADETRGQRQQQGQQQPRQDESAVASPAPRGVLVSAFLCEGGD